MRRRHPAGTTATAASTRLPLTKSRSLPNLSSLNSSSSSSHLPRLPRSALFAHTFEAATASLPRSPSPDIQRPTIRDGDSNLKRWTAGQQPQRAHLDVDSTVHGEEQLEMMGNRTSTTEGRIKRKKLVQRASYRGVEARGQQEQRTRMRPTFSFELEDIPPYFDPASDSHDCQNERHELERDDHHELDYNRSPSPLSSSSPSPSPSQHHHHSVPASPSLPSLKTNGDGSTPPPDDIYAHSPSPPETPLSSSACSSPDHDASRARSSRRGRRWDSVVLFSLWDYLQEEVLAVEMEGGEEGVKSERVTNFLTVPGEVEKIIGFGFIICLDSFLYTFTILPLRVITAFTCLLSNITHNTLRISSSSASDSASGSPSKKHLRLSHKCDLVKAVITIGTLLILNRITDASQMYHSVRGQETLKLYVIFNVLEIADRLCCSFGQDLQDSLFSRQTLGRRIDGSHPRIRPIALVGLNLCYVVAHTLVLFYQLVTLNVAINSYSNALLTLLLSNQFVEIKSAVFKKFEKEQLFQVTCADIVERFQLAIMLFIIALRNLIELSSSTTLSSTPLLSLFPSSFSLSPLPLFSSFLPTLALLQTIFSPAVIVLLSECAVDWLKHAFITKFNHIRPAVYGRFIDVLCKDLVGGFSAGGGSRQRDQPFVDQSPIVSRRLGFAALPLGCLVVRVLFQAFEMLTDHSHLDECAFVTTPGGAGGLGIGVKVGGMGGRSGFAIVILGGCVAWACLIALKLIIGINLRAFASSRYATMELRIQADMLNERSRPHMGASSLEKELNRQATSLLSDHHFDVPGAKTRGKISMETLSRYDMIKSRVW